MLESGAGGEPRWVATTKVPFRDAAGRPAGIVCISRDVTERVLNEQRMRELRDFLDSIVENIPIMLFVKDAADLKYLRFNREAERLLGLSRDELVGRYNRDFFPPDQADAFTRADRAVIDGGVPLDIPAEPIDTRSLGRRILHTQKIPVFGADGRPRYLLGISEDITDRVEADRKLREQNEELARLAERERLAYEQLKAAQSRMVQSEKLASLGQLVAGVAHEINNPLAFVSNNVTVLQRDLKGIRLVLDLYRQADGTLAEHRPALAGELRDLVEQIDLAYTLDNLDGLFARSRDGLKRIQQIVKDLRNFARLDEADLNECDLNAGVESTLNIVKGRAKSKKVELATDFGELPFVTCYPAKVNQVVMNLVTNAIDACADGGKVTVQTRAEGAGDEAAVRIRVSDNGSGIPPEVRDRIFDPFFTTKPQGEGTGLGLSISYGIVQDHDGAIEVDSEVGRGTTFTVTIPKRGPRGSRTRRSE